MSNPQVICLGEILFDCLADQQGRSLTEVESWSYYPGGAPANVACALVKLGTPAGFVGCMGENEAGDALSELLQEVGVDRTGVQRHSTAPTRQVYTLRTESGDREFAGFTQQLHPGEFADAYLQAEQLPMELFERADFLVLGTLELAYPRTRAAIFRALELAEQYNVKILVDINWRPIFWSDPSQAEPLIQKLWNYVDFLKLSAEEAQWLFNTTDAGAIAHRLDSVEGVLVSNGGEEVSYCLNDNEGRVPAFSVEVQDTTGAGDGLVAGLVHQLCQRGIASLSNPDTAREIVTYACAVGGLTTTNSGAIAAQPTASQVEAFLSQMRDKS